MRINLSDQEAAVLREFIGSRLGALSMEISHTDNPRYRTVLRADRDILRRVYDDLGSAAPAAADGAAV